MALVSGTCLGQPIYVEAQDVIPHPFGLFSVAVPADSSDPHWQMGVEFEPYPGTAAALPYACPTCVQTASNTAPAKTYTAGVSSDSLAAAPVTVYASFACSPVGNWDRAEDRALRALQNGAERAVEAELAAGTHSVSRSLTSAATVDITPVPGTPVSNTNGIALLEAYVRANSPSQGVILGNARDIVLADSNNRLTVPSSANPSQLQTFPLATPVVALSGFNGRTGPNGVAAGAGNSWLFATLSPIRLWKSEPFLTPPNRENGLKTSTNDLRILAEQTFLCAWSYGTIAVLVTSV